MNILLDVDGVLADFIGLALSEINRITWPLGKAFGRAAVVKRDMITALGLEDNRQEIESVFCELGFATRIEPIDGAVAGIKALAEAGNNIFAVTAPMPGSVSWTYERDKWLIDHFKIHPREVLHVRSYAKHLVTGDVFVDDDPDTVRRWAATNPDCLAVLFGQPHNVSERTDLVWVKNWSNLVSLIAEHKNEKAAA